MQRNRSFRRAAAVGAVFAAVAAATAPAHAEAAAIVDSTRFVAPTTTAATGKKRCRVVVKKIHGHKRKVRVCRTVKPPPPPPPPAAAKVVGRVSVGTGPPAAIVSMAVGDGAVWMALGDASTIVRVDPSSLSVVATLSNPLPAEWPPWVGVGFGSAWLANAIPAINDDPVSGALVRIDEHTNHAVKTIPVGRSPEGLAFAYGSVWAANHRSDQPLGTPAPHSFSVSRVDPASGVETARIPVERRADTFDDWNNFCCGLAHLTVGAGSIWTDDATTQTVYRIDPNTNAVTAAIHAPAGAEACGELAFEGGKIWVAGSCDSPIVWWIDPNTNTVAGSLTVPGSFQLASGLGSVWIGSPSTKDLLLRIDPATGAITGQTPVAGIGPIAIGEGAIWVAQGTTLLKLEPA